MAELLRCPFSKYHALGNHFIIVDNRERQFDLSATFIKEMCSPRTGVGANNLLELRRCEHKSHRECSYEIVNYGGKNGSLGALCGNGSRCMAAFAHKLGIVPANQKFGFCGFDGEHFGHVNVEENLVEIGMKDVTDVRVYDEENFNLWTGSPIHVKFISDLMSLDIQKEGSAIRDDAQRYPKKVNVMFVQESSERELTMRSFERGDCGETWSCGTGTVGVGLVAMLRDGPYREPAVVCSKVIHTRLGKLIVKAKRTGDKAFEEIVLIGPTCHVFDGEYFYRGC